MFMPVRRALFYTFTPRSRSGLCCDNGALRVLFWERRTLIAIRKNFWTPHGEAWPEGDHVSTNGQVGITSGAWLRGFSLVLRDSHYFLSINGNFLGAGTCIALGGPNPV